MEHLHLTDILFVSLIALLSLALIFCIWSFYYKKSSQVLNQAKRLHLMRAILDNSPSCIYVKDLKHRYLLVNPYALRLFHFTEKEAIGKTDADLFSAHFFKKSSTSDAEVFKLGCTTREEYTTESKYGMRVFYEVKTPLRDHKGRIFGLCGIATEITEKKRAQEQLNNYLEKLEGITTELIDARLVSEQANRVKDHFLANMSHEFRTPLYGILGNLALLFHTNLDEKQRKYIERIDVCSKILLELIESVLDFSKVSAGQLKMASERCDIIALVSECASVCKVLADEKNLEFRIELPKESLPSIMADPLHLKRVLMNLLNNAIKFTEKGFIGLSLTVLSKTSETLFARFEIEDSGIGIPEGKMKFLFEKFWQADTSSTRKYGGTGLGLAIAKELVTLMGGNIKAISREGVGSTFTVEIPFFVAHQS